MHECLHDVSPVLVFTAGEVRPSYLMLLGSTDVIPHVPLVNPMAGDGDADVPSDLPYACDMPYSREPSKNLVVTRVVGRIPGIMGAPHPTHLTNAMNATRGVKG